jgi:hypothetical protein
VAHGQHVSFGRVLNVQRASIRSQQPERTFLFPPLLQGFPELRNVRLRAWLCEVADRAADDLFPRQPEELADADAGVPGIAIVVGDEDGCGRVIENRPEQDLEFSWAVLHQPAGGW